MLAKIENWSAKGRWDTLGMGLAGLCLVHCLASAIILTILASAGGILFHPAIHEIGMVFAIFFGATAMISGYKRHGYILPLLLSSVGLAIMMGALSIGHGSGEILLTMIGITILALGHYFNIRASR